MVKHFKFLNKILNFSAERYLRTAGDLFIHQGDYESALAMVEKTLEIEPQDARALVLRGDILFCLNRDTEALRTFNQALSLHPACVEALISRAGVLDVLGKHRDALDSCNKAFSLMSDRHDYLMPSLYEQKIALLVRLKKYRQAQQLLAEAQQALSPEEYNYLLSCYAPAIQRYCQTRGQSREKAKQLSLRVVNTPE